MPLPDNIIIGNAYKFAYPEQFTSLPEYTAHAGKTCIVVRQCTEEEADQGDDMERMFKIRFPEDGFEGEAWASELQD